MAVQARMLAGAVALALLAALAAKQYWDRTGAAEAVAPAERQADYFPFVKSMEGTRPDGELKTGPSDRLVVDAELAYLFDYYLAGLGERELGDIRAEIERELDRRLKPAAAQEAKRLLANYLAYKQALAELEAGVKPGADLLQNARERRQAMMALRKRYFSEAEIAGLFGATDARDADAMARLEVARERGLSEAQRKEKLAQLDAGMTPAQRAEREAPMAVVNLEDAVRRARAAGAGENEVYKLRSEALSPEAASRLADLDREEAQWRGRIASYQAERQRLQGAGEPAVQQLRDARFTAQEQKRLAAYE